MEPPKPLLKTPYFPQGIFSDDKEMDAHWAAWKARQLAVMKEPSLWAALRDHSVHSYRFLWMRTFHPPISVRLVVKPDGTGEAIAVVTNGKGGFRPGSIVFRQRSKVSQKDTADVLQKLAKIGFWSLPTHDTRTFKNAAGQLVLVRDGAGWYLEGVQNGRYHLVQRSSPRDTPFGRLCLRLLDLGAVPVKARTPVY